MGDSGHTKTDGPDKADIREDMVNTAVRFLENPRVSRSSEEAKRAFLLKKGLTPQEVDAAHARARPPGRDLVIPHQTIAPVQLQQYSAWMRLTHLANALVSLAGSVYVMKYLWENYIRDWLYGRRPKRKTTLETLLEVQEGLQDELHNLSLAVHKLQESLPNTRDVVKEKDFSDLRRDVQSVKGLLLSSSRFPQHPPVLAPSLPPWQLATAKSSVNGSDNEGIKEDAGRSDQIVLDSPDLVAEEQQVGWEHWCHQTSMLAVTPVIPTKKHQTLP